MFFRITNDGWKTSLSSKGMVSFQGTFVIFFWVSGYFQWFLCESWIHRDFFFKDFADSANDQATLTLNFWGICKYLLPSRKIRVQGNF